MEAVCLDPLDFWAASIAGCGYRSIIETHYFVGESRLLLFKFVLVLDPSPPASLTAPRSRHWLLLTIVAELVFAFLHGLKYEQLKFPVCESV